MNLGIDILTHKQDPTLDLIEAYESIIELTNDIAKIEYMSSCMENLYTVQALVEKGGVTSAIESVFGQEFLAASMEVTAGDIGRAVSKGLLAFGKAVMGLISKVIAFIQKFTSAKRSDVSSVITKIEGVIKDIQMEPIGSGIPASEVLKLCGICDEHFKVKVDVIMPSTDNAEKDVIRRETLSAFNKKVKTEAVVGNDYKMEFKPTILKDTNLKELGYTTAGVFTDCLNKINACRQSANNTITQLKNSNTAIERMVKALESNSFHKEESNQGSVQVAYVYTKIVFSDVAALFACEGKVNSIVTACEKHSGRYAKTKDDVSENEANRNNGQNEKVTINN